MQPVIVAGAGPVGLATAYGLARRAVSVVVLDAGDGRAAHRPSRTCVLRPVTLPHLPPLRGARWESWRTTHRRRPVRETPLEPAEAPLHLAQHDLERTLREALAAYGHVRFVPGAVVRGVEQDVHGVTVRTAKGEVWRGSHLVGCDGARSTVRKLLRVRFPGRTSVERHAVAALRVALPDPARAGVHRDPARGVGEVTYRPLPGGLWRLDWLLSPRGGLVTPEAMVGRIEATLAAWEGAPERYELLDTGVHTVHQRLARRWRVERTFLAGDAAHLTGALGVPSLDEGLQDAVNLAWKLAAVWHEPHAPGVEALLDSYERERRAAAAARLRAVDRALATQRPGSPLRTLLTGGGAPARLALLDDGHLGRGPLGAPPHYAASPLTPVASPPAVQLDTAPGEGAHDVPVTALDGTRTTLRERLGASGAGLFTVLVAPGTGVWDSRHWLHAGLMPRLTAAVAALPLEAELLVAESYPGAPAHTVLVLRPDGHLVTALQGVREPELRACALAVRGDTAPAPPQAADGRRAAG